ncbi:uncharacterized protein METZ01_LOCUS288527, partial [marine metagenome]
RVEAVIRLRRLNGIWKTADGTAHQQLTLDASVFTFDLWLLGDGSFC